MIVSEKKKRPCLSCTLVIILNLFRCFFQILKFCYSKFSRNYDFNNFKICFFKNLKLSSFKNLKSSDFYKY